jgi:hypothetical protein
VPPPYGITGTQESEQIFKIFDASKTFLGAATAPTFPIHLPRGSSAYLWLEGRKIPRPQATSISAKSFLSTGLKVKINTPN